MSRYKSPGVWWVSLSSTEDTPLGLGEGWHLIRAWRGRRTHLFRLPLCSHQYDMYLDIIGKSPTNNYGAAILHELLSLTCPPTRCEFCGWCPALFTRGLNQTWHRICTTEGKVWFRGIGVLTSNVQDVAEEHCVCSRYFRRLGEDEVIDSVTLTDCLQRAPEYKWAPSLWRT